MKDVIVHPAGEGQNGALEPVSEPVAVDTFGEQRPRVRSHIAHG